MGSNLSGMETVKAAPFAAGHEAWIGRVHMPTSIVQNTAFYQTRSSEPNLGGIRTCVTAVTLPCEQDAANQGHSSMTK